MEWYSTTPSHSALLSVSNNARWVETIFEVMSQLLSLRILYDITNNPEQYSMREILCSGESETRTTYLADRNKRPNQLSLPLKRLGKAVCFCLNSLPIYIYINFTFSKPPLFLPIFMLGETYISPLYRLSWKILEPTRCLLEPKV